MSAVITDELKRKVLGRILAEVNGDVGADSDSYFIGIGKSEPWNDSDIPDTAYNHGTYGYDERQFRYGLQSVKKVVDASFIVPRVNWASGTIYQAYSDKSEGHPTTPFYALSDANNVYVCVERARNADGSLKTSTIAPTGQSTSVLSTADGYRWQFLYTIPTSRSIKFLSSNYMPVALVDSDDAVASVPDAIQKSIQDAAVPGQVLNCQITAGGTGYTSAPTVVFAGNGTDAAATATVTAGVVTRIVMTNRGSGYTNCQVTLTGGGGSGATLRPVIANKGGLGSNPLMDLKSKALMFNIKADGLENDDFIVDNEFRQMGLLNNILNPAGDRFEGSTALALKKLILSSPSEASTFSLDQEITGSVSGTKALIDYIDSDILFYHQTPTTGFGAFDSDIASTITASGASGTLSSIIDSADIDNLSGSLLYLENRAAVERSLNQTEDIKIIIQI